MRVLLVRSSVHMAGVERVLLWLAQELRARGVTVGIAALFRTSDPPLPHPLVVAARAAGVPAWTLSDRGPWDPRLLGAFRGLLRRFRPTLVHTHDYKGDALAALLVPTKWVATAHGYTGEDGKVRLYETLDRYLLRRARRVVVPSAYSWGKLRRFGIPAHRLHVVPHGVDWGQVDAWAAQPLPPKAEKDVRGGPVLTFMGRHSPEKGGDVLLRALPTLLQEIPTLHVWFLGDGAARATWQTRAHHRGVAGRVRFWGWRENPFPFLAASTLLVVPSQRESFGLSAVEAQGLGVPVVTSGVGGLAEVLVPDGVRSFRSGLGDADALLQGVREILVHVSEAKAGARRARDAVRRRYTVARMTTAYIHVYEQIHQRDEETS